MTELERRLRGVEPGWRFVSRREWNRARAKLRGAGCRVPEAQNRPLSIPPAIWNDESVPLENYWLVLDPSELGIARRPLDDQLAFFWPWLFAIRLHPTVDAVGSPLSLVEFRDVAVALEARRWVPDPPTEVEIASAFAVDFLTAMQFAPETIGYQYPGLCDPISIRNRLLSEAKLAAIAEATRPDGIASETSITGAPAESRRFRDPARAESFRASALETLEQGNSARAAILFTAAVRACSTGSSKSRNDAKLALRRAVERLAKTFAWEAPQSEAWFVALQPLLIPATKSHWSPAAKALYDLQRIAVERETEAYSIDPFRWLGSLGRRPLLLPIAHAFTAQTLLRLRKIGRHSAQAGLPAGELLRLQEMLNVEIEKTELTLRHALEPIISMAFRDAGLIPTNVIERIALPKIADELLDRTAETGFFRFGDLRDALARNALKMPDLAGPVEWIRGDALLRANAILARELDGVYYPAEIYLRLFQRGSSLAFGTALGRWVALYLALPFGAAFMTVEFAKYLAHEIGAVAGFVGHLFVPAPADSDEKHAHHGIALTPTTIGFVLGIGAVYLPMLHSQSARSFAGRAFGWLGTGLKTVFVTAPSFIWNSAPARWIRRNPVVAWFHRKLALPLIGAGVATAVAGVVDGTPEAALASGAAIFLILLIAGHTTVGSRGIERAADAARWTWLELRTNFFPGLLGWIVWFFRGALAALDRSIYSIDEWFRFRSGQSKVKLAVKIGLGLLWFPVRYVLRFAIYLLVEPQINPLKHFPVVTVSHKLLLPMIPAIAAATGIHKKWIATAMSGVPGIFGFLAWELRENWRLYSANRPEKIVPLAIGHHGETVRALLRPGFHSGTVPRQYAAIRKALAKADRTGDPPKLAGPLLTLHHAEHAVRHLVEREFLAYLAATRVWAGVKIECSRIDLALRFIRATVRTVEARSEILFELIDDQIGMTCDSTAILEQATVERKEIWDRALLGLAAMAAVPTGEPRLNWNVWLEFWTARTDEPIA